MRSSDPTHIKLLKLEILTNLATATSISMILREFQTYISSSDKDFVAATIQAIGRCAATIKEVTETCLSGLVKLLSNKDGEFYLHAPCIAFYLRKLNLILNKILFSVNLPTHLFSISFNVYSILTTFPSPSQNTLSPSPWSSSRNSSKPSPPNTKRSSPRWPNCLTLSPWPPPVQPSSG